jgi:hypothetical protein
VTETLVATDLDRTLIYSAAALALGNPDVPTELVCVEHYQGREASFMTVDAARLFGELLARTTVVPVSTRLPAQLARVVLPGAPQQFAVAANGGVLLVNGVVDQDWSDEVGRRLAGCTPLAEVRAELQQVCRPEWTKALRDADGLFCYAVVDRAALPSGVVEQLTAWTHQRGWQTSLQGGKLYCLPAALTKSAAVTEVARRTGCTQVLAAGDSLLDLDLLLAADLGIHPRHGELADSGWSAPHVVRTESAGARAGEEILSWFAAAVATGPGGSAEQQGRILQRPLDDKAGGTAHGRVRAEGRSA